MEMITISAKTLDEAITKALLELQTTSEHLYYEVAQKESTGFLGLFGGKPCVIRARVMGEEEERKKKKKNYICKSYIFLKSIIYLARKIMKKEEKEEIEN